MYILRISRASMSINTVPIYSIRIMTKYGNYVHRFARFNRFTNSPCANYKGELYSLPFNMYTFNKMWGVVTPEEAKAKIQEQVEASRIDKPQNLEEQAISLVGTDIYEKLIKGYTQKQWGRECKDLPAFIIKRLPVRYTSITITSTHYIRAFQLADIQMVESMLEGADVMLGEDYLEDKERWNSLAQNSHLHRTDRRIFRLLAWRTGIQISKI